MKSWVLCLCLVSVLATGCNSKPGASAPNGASAQAGADQQKKTILVRRDGKEVLGNWVYVFTIQGRDSYRWLLKFSLGEDGKTKGEFLDTRQDKADPNVPELAETEIHGDSVRLVIKSGSSTIDFVGSFQAGIVRGTTKFGPTELMLTRLLQSDETSLAKFDPTASPPGANLFQAAMGGKDLNPAELLVTLKENQTSPLTQDVYALLLSRHAATKFDDVKIKELVQDFLESAKIWGARWEARTELLIATHLTTARRFPELALEHLNAAEEKLVEDKDAYKEQIAAYREAINVQIRVRQVSDPAVSEEVKAAAEAELTEILKTQRYNAEILFALADRAEKRGEIDQAIDYLSDIVAIPLLEFTIIQLHAGEPPNPPNEILKRLWTQKHNNLDGYDQHVADVYNKRISELNDDLLQKNPITAPKEPTDRTVLVELFTGMRSLPCVPSELAMDAITKTYPRDKVIVVRLHQHIPDPDGLANQDSEERASFYEINSTPCVILDGLKIDPRFYTGPMQAVTSSYNVFRKVIESRLAEKSGVEIKVSANIEKGLLEVNADVTGIPEDQLPSCRLRMAIVEDRVHAFLPLAMNGIRDHDFVVREILGGSKGIPPKNGELKYSSSMPVDDLQQRLIKYISQFEAGRRLQFPPEIKPVIQGPLSVVAWVQSGTPDKKFGMRYVLQSKIVPIRGETGFAPTAAESASAEGSKSENPTAPVAPK